MKISELNQEQRGHLGWRLDHHTAMGLITIGRLIRGEFGDDEIVDIFIKAGKTRRSALAHAKKVEQFYLQKLPSNVSLEREQQRFIALTLWKPEKTDPEYKDIMREFREIKGLLVYEQNSRIMTTLYFYNYADIAALEHNLASRIPRWLRYHNAENEKLAAREAAQK